jgi:hypothetical protein
MDVPITPVPIQPIRVCPGAHCNTIALATFRPPRDPVVISLHVANWKQYQIAAGPESPSKIHRNDDAPARSNPEHRTAAKEGLEGEVRSRRPSPKNHDEHY